MSDTDSNSDYDSDFDAKPFQNYIHPNYYVGNMLRIYKATLMRGPVYTSSGTLIDRNSSVTHWFYVYGNKNRLKNVIGIHNLILTRKIPAREIYDGKFFFASSTNPSKIAGTCVHNWCESDLERYLESDYDESEPDESEPDESEPDESEPDSDSD